MTHKERDQCEHYGYYQKYPNVRGKDGPCPLIIEDDKIGPEDGLAICYLDAGILTKEWLDGSDLRRQALWEGKIIP